MHTLSRLQSLRCKSPHLRVVQKSKFPQNCQNSFRSGNVSWRGSFESLFFCPPSNVHLHCLWCFCFWRHFADVYGDYLKAFRRGNWLKAFRRCNCILSATACFPPPLCSKWGPVWKPLDVSWARLKASGRCGAPPVSLESAEKYQQYGCSPRDILKSVFIYLFPPFIPRHD